MITPKIYCKRIIYKDSVPFERINYFNKDVFDILYPEAKQELEDVIDISSFKYDHGKVLSGDTLELIKKCGNINITFGTIANDYYSYFNIKSTFKKCLYLFWVTYDNMTVFTGATNQEGISYNEEPAPDSERIKVEVKSLSNHFLEYNRAQYCNITEVDNVFSRTLEISGTEYRSAYIEPFFNKLFFKSNPLFNCINNTGYAWEINRQPFFFVNYADKYHFLTNGFRKIGAPTVLGQYETKTGFFITLCNAMGWDFDITGDFLTELTTLTIRNRYRPAIGITRTTDDIASINYNTEFEDSSVDYIVIRDGYLQADTAVHNSSTTIPVKIITLNGTYLNNGYFFKNAANVTGTWKLYTYPSTEYYLASNTQSEGEYLDFGKIAYSSASFFDRSTTRIRIDNKFILYIDAGENTYGSAVDLNTKANANDVTGLGTIANGFYYKGSYGSMMFYRDGVYIRNYDDYSKTDTFRNNFKTILKNKDSDTIEVLWNALFTDYYGSGYSQIVLSGGGAYLNATWDITELELDLINETTKMKLKRAA